MAQENWLRVATTAMALGVGLYLIPIGMVAQPDLIRLADAPVPAVIAALLVGGGCLIVAYGLISVQGLWKSALALILGLGIIYGLPALI